MEEEEVEVPVTKEPEKEAAKMETDEAPNDAAPPSSSETDVNMQDAKGTADAPGTENGVPESGDKPTQMETDKVGVTGLNDFFLSVLVFVLMNYICFALVKNPLYQVMSCVQIFSCMCFCIHMARVTFCFTCYMHMKYKIVRLV